MNKPLVTVICLVSALAFGRAVRKPLPAKEVPKLVKDLYSADADLRCRAVMNLDYSEAPELVKKELPRFLELARRSDACTRGAAIETLSKLWPDNQEAFQIALAQLDTGDRDLQWRAANAAAGFACHIHSPAQLTELRKAYAKHLRTAEVNTRLLQATGCFGDEAAPLLESALASPDRSVQSTAIMTLTRVAQNTNVPAVREKALASLQAMAPHPENQALWQSHLQLLKQLSPSLSK